MLLANENTYRELSTFDSLEQLNEAVRAHRRANKLNKTELAVLDILSQYSCNDKHFGVSFRTKNNIAKLIGKCRRTIIRVCQHLEALGIIRQVECYRKSDGRQTSNAIVILPAETENVTLTPIENVTPRHSGSINSNTVIYNTYSRTVARQVISPYIPFKNTVQTFIGIGDTKLVNRLYGIWLAHTSYLKPAYNENTLLTVGIEAIKATMQATKRQEIRNLAGFFNGVLDRMLDRLHDQTVYGV